MELKITATKKESNPPISESEITQILEYLRSADTDIKAIGIELLKNKSKEDFKVFYAAYVKAQSTTTFGREVFEPMYSLRKYHGLID